MTICLVSKSRRSITATRALRLVVDEEELAVVVAVGLATGRVVGVGPGDRRCRPLSPLGEHRFGVVAEAVALPRLGREDADDLEHAHRRHADDSTWPPWPPDAKMKYSSFLPVGM